jgi:NAD(P)H-hydrate epimerase
MENAGRSCAESLVWHSHHCPRDQHAVVVLCGPGNNGGDGFVIARHLYNLGFKVKVVLFCRSEAYSGDARLNLNALAWLRLSVVELTEKWSQQKIESALERVGRKKTTWIVDALLGTGAKGQPRNPMDRAIEVANQLNSKRLAVDIPTGLDCDTGEPESTTFRADLTCTFIDTKVGFENPNAKPYLGEVLIEGIGAPKEIVGAS